MSCFKVGDVVRYKYNVVDSGFREVFRETTDQYPALVLYVNKEGGTLKVLDSDGGIEWYVTSYCEKIA